MINTIIKRIVCIVLMSALTVQLTSLEAAAKETESVDAVTEAAEATEATEAPDSSNPEAQLQLELVSFSDEGSEQGRTIGAVIKVKNSSDKIIRIPNLEVQMRMSDGTIHKMLPSTDNVKSLQPGSAKDHRFVSQIEADADVHPVELRWMKVNRKVYPKTEELVFALDLIRPQQPVEAWGEPLTIPGQDPAITVTPVRITKDYVDANAKQSLYSNQPLNHAYLVTFLVTNTSESKKKLPKFKINGIKEDQIYEGVQLKEQDEGAVVLAPSEKRYVRFVIHTEEQVELQHLDLQAIEPFIQLDPQGMELTTELSVARTQINLPFRSQTILRAVDYHWGSAMEIDRTVSQLIPQHLEVSLAGYSILGEEDAGYKTALLKFRLNNRGDYTVQLPKFETELVASYGTHYAGIRQETSIQQILPKTSALILYTYMISESDITKDLKLRVTDDQTAAPYRTDIAANWVRLDERKTNNRKFDLYPFTIEVTGFKADKIAYYNPETDTEQTNGLQVKFDLKIKREPNIIVDPGFTGIEFELTDHRNRRLAPTQQFSITGANKLADGTQQLLFSGLDGWDSEYPLFINVYETVDTINGTVKRLLGKFAK